MLKLDGSPREFCLGYLAIQTQSIRDAIRSVMAEPLNAWFFLSSSSTEEIVSIFSHLFDRAFNLLEAFLAWPSLMDLGLSPPTQSSLYTAGVRAMFVGIGPYHGVLPWHGNNWETTTCGLRKRDCGMKQLQNMHDTFPRGNPVQVLNDTGRALSWTEDSTMNSNKRLRPRSAVGHRLFIVRHAR